METGHRFPYTEHSIHHCHSDLYFRLWGRRLCERGSHVLCSECLLHPDPSRLLSLSCHCTFTKNGRVCGDVSASLLSLSTTRSRRWDLYELLGHTARVCQDVPWQHLTHFPGPWNHPPHQNEFSTRKIVLWRKLIMKGRLISILKRFFLLIKLFK